MDAITSFTYLVDNIPLWKDQITQLSKHTSQKHQEFKAEYNRIVAQAKPRRIKSPSICSIHTDKSDQKDLDVNPEPSPQPPNPVDISPFEAGNRYIYAQATKKRKPGTSFRSGASGPLKFRSKQAVVIYYDSYAQDQLESIVKAIGSSRNNLRKGRMAYTVSKGLKLPTLGRKHDLTSSLPGLEGVKASAAIRSAPKISDAKPETILTTVEAIPTGEAAFKHVDKELETCQNLCETAAHQFLRDGDCTLELETAIQNLDTILDLTKATLETFKAEEKKDESLVEHASVNSSTHTTSDSTLVEKSSQELLRLGQKSMPSPEAGLNAKRPSVPTVNSAPPMMTEIEVDDDDDSDQSSIELDLSKFRAAARAGNRPGLRT